MATITPGTGGTIKSSTLENALYEALSLASNWENDLTKNPSGEKLIALSIDQSAKRITASWTFPMNREKSANGSTAFPIKSNLSSTGFVPGTGGTIVSANIYAAIIELAEEIQKREQDASKNPQSLNAVTSLNYDSEALTCSGSISLSCDFAIDATGNILIRARNYLTD